MEDKEILARLEKILKSEERNRRPFIEKNVEVTPKKAFRKDFGMDSMDQYEFCYATEEEIGINIPDEKMNEFETVGEYVQYIKDYQEEGKTNHNPVIIVQNSKKDYSQNSKEADSFHKYPGFLD
jgi:acyl carrier protein